MKAVVLLSGGLDSCVVAAGVGKDVVAVSFRYGQRHAAELRAAERVAEALGIRERFLIDVDAGALRSPLLKASSEGVPKDRPASSGVAPTYVPGRNTIFLAHALGVAETVGAQEIWVGVNAVDYSGYPDCRPAFVRAFQGVVDALALRIEVRTPLLHLSKREIVERGNLLAAPMHLTLSCYDPSEDGVHCGRCASCRIRREGFAAASVADLSRYA